MLKFSVGDFQTQCWLGPWLLTQPWLWGREDQEMVLHDCVYWRSWNWRAGDVAEPPCTIRSKCQSSSDGARIPYCALWGCWKNHVPSSGQGLHGAAENTTPLAKKKKNYIFMFSCCESSNQDQLQKSPGDSQATTQKGILKIREILKKIWQGWGHYVWNIEEFWPALSFPSCLPFCCQDGGVSKEAEATKAMAVRKG